jgi:large subunit ribosomal protein L15
MITLSKLKNTDRPKKKVQRVGRGMGSKRGKTCGRGIKGDKARQGYKTRDGYEGGQLPLYRKLPCRGFAQGRFRSTVFAITLGRINELFADGEVVNLETLREKGCSTRRALGGLKVLSGGELKKKVSIEAHGFSAAAKEQLEKHSIPFTSLKTV